jgi:hypothetical protein
MITSAPTHFDGSPIAVGKKTPSLVNLLERNLARAALEDDVDTLVQ